MIKRAIVWFRNDLRLHDNEALTEALRSADEIIPVYIFDDRIFKGETHFGFPKTGVHRAQFIIESVADLRLQFQNKGNDLYIRVGKPEEIIYEMARATKCSWVYCNRERTDEELKVQDTLEKNLWAIGQELRFCRGKMLYHTADLPFPVQHTPEIFTTFRKEVERITPVRTPLPTPETISKNTFVLDRGDIPSLEDFGHLNYEKDTRAAFNLIGGETEGLKRLNYYLEETHLIKTYEETRNGLIGADYSTKFSAYLSAGCLSPKMIYQELKKYEKQYGDNKSTYWLYFELIWRDFFRLIGKKYGNAIFQVTGLTGKSKSEKPWRTDVSLFHVWADGRTGIPFIDANMRELKQTGFMSNRGRQNVASFLTKDLKINWLMGAEWFESQLVDYDPCSNYGNWLYIAGVGNDPRENRYFNILSQARNYDPTGAYVKLWLPELAALPPDKVHRPDTLSSEEQTRFQIKLGVQYPKAMIPTEKWQAY